MREVSQGHAGQGKAASGDFVAKDLINLPRYSPGYHVQGEQLFREARAKSGSMVGDVWLPWEMHSAWIPLPP